MFQKYYLDRRSDFSLLLNLLSKTGYHKRQGVIALTSNELKHFKYHNLQRFYVHRKLISFLNNKGDIL